jgi:hypothetical protein
MRKAMLILAVLGLVGSLWAADPSLGTWKLNVAKSKFPPNPTGQAALKEETRVVRQVGDQIETTTTGSRTDGSPISSKSTRPQQGGVIKSQTATTEDRMAVFTVVEPNNCFITLLQKGGQVVVVHSVISKDGKTMIDTGKGVDDKGKPVEYLGVWEKQ